MLLTPFLGQSDLFLSLGKTCPVVGAALGKTSRTRYAFDEMCRILVLLGDWTATCMAQFHFAQFKAVFHRYALVEYKTFALPFTFYFRNVLQISQYPAFKVIDLVDTLGFQESSRFLATNSACAEHREFGLA